MTAHALALLRSLVLAAVCALAVPAQAQSVARLWNEALLEAIRDDFARPTVHARNLFHVSVAMYDAWAIYQGRAMPYVVGGSINGISCDVAIGPAPADVAAARDQAISFAAYRLLVARFRNSPGAIRTLPRLDALMDSLGYDRSDTSTHTATGNPAAFGNRIAECVYTLGLADGANEARGYRAEHYEPVNPPLITAEPGNPTLADFNRWQPLQFDRFIDQSGNEVPGGVPDFVGPEWGSVRGFALDPGARSFFDRDGTTYVVHHDPGPPPRVALDGSEQTAAFVGSMTRVLDWSSHLDPDDGAVWDISPGALGNLELPPPGADTQPFYDAAGRGEIGPGWGVNPRTGLPYAPNPVARGDYTRVLAEFWADGPDSETPPGHWFTILNTVNDSPLLVRRWAGQGPELDELEWDVKVYLALGGAVHDAAISAWGLKGRYDSIRPVSAIRALAALGQSSQPDAADFHPAGLPLIPGQIERIQSGDPLAGDADEHIGALKVLAWRGPEAVPDPEVDVGGVGWIRVAEWWPYQRPTFVSPPFAGYVSGHSTFSRAAAEVLTAATGDPFFPGGLGEFAAPRDTFLVFEAGPSADVTLQWATYRDAADQCSLSRIWGGIHPPFDDLPGRRIGREVGVAAVDLAEALFDGQRPTSSQPPPEAGTLAVSPSPVAIGRPVTIRGTGRVDVFDARGRRVSTLDLGSSGTATLPTSGLAPGVYAVRARSGRDVLTRSLVVLR